MEAESPPPKLAHETNERGWSVPPDSNREWLAPLSSELSVSAVAPGTESTGADEGARTPDLDVGTVAFYR